MTDRQGRPGSFFDELIGRSVHGLGRDRTEGSRDGVAELLAAWASLPWALPLAGLQWASGLLARGPAPGGHDHLPRDQPMGAGGPGAGGSEEVGRSAARPSTGATGSARVAVDTGPFARDPGRLPVGRFVVLGESLTAGMGAFTLSRATQGDSFPVLVARALGIELPQALLEEPGLGELPGFPPQPVIVPGYAQSTLLVAADAEAPRHDLSIPGFRVVDALRRRPRQPLVHRRDTRQTLANLILGWSSFVHGDGGGRTQLETAVALQPKLALVALGYQEAMEAAAAGDPLRMPPAREVERHFDAILRALRAAGAEVVVTTIPDPLETAGYAKRATAAEVVKVAPEILGEAYGIADEDRVTMPGLVEIGCQLLSRRLTALPLGAVLPAEAARAVSHRVAEANEAIGRAAGRHGVLVFDLAALFRRWAAGGTEVAGRRLGVAPLGGLFWLSGCLPGKTAHALIADELVRFLADAYGARLPPVDVAAAAARDPVAAYVPAGGPCWTSEQLGAAPPRTAAPRPSAPRPVPPAPAGTGATWQPLVSEQPPDLPIRLPEGLEQVVELSPAGSYFGDSILAIHCDDEAAARWGSSQNLLFGGLAMTLSHVAGRLRVRFQPPVDGASRFELSLEGDLVGEDGLLAAPLWYRLPSLENRIQAIPGRVGSGVLELATGRVSDVEIALGFANSALLALIRVNPAFPQVPIEFPGQYGSADVAFANRADGRLEVTFEGRTFLPLGAALGGRTLMFPLPFAGPTLEFAAVPAPGTALHPQIRLSTREPRPPDGAAPPDFEPNSVRELTLFTHNSSFGDQFHLDVPELGGDATGRSHVMGRVRVQLGPAAGGRSLPVAISNLNPGGLLAPFAETPISEAFPGRLPPGPIGYDAFLRFPLRAYGLNDLSVIDDPFDLSVGVVDPRSGWLINRLLHRGFINQDLIFALLRVEPRTPEESFFFCGPARFQRGGEGQTVFRFQGQVLVPYPQGFRWPQPNLATAFTVRSNGRLDPFLWLHAIEDDPDPRNVARGGADEVVGDTGERFSFRYEIPARSEAGAGRFEYVNHTAGASFRMHSLTWVGFGQSLGAPRRGHDTFTFGGFGVWRSGEVESVQQFSAQVSTSSRRPFVGIQIGAAQVSNVDTKPPLQEDALP